MTLNKAIKRLQNLAIHHRDDTFHENEEALKLGVEALKRERDRRDHRIPGWNTPLPGETEE